MALISISCLIALARNSSTIMNRCGENGHLCFAPNIRRNLPSFLSLKYDNCSIFHTYPWLGGRSSPLFLVYQKVLFIYFLNQDFFSPCIYWNDHMDFPLLYVNMVNDTDLQLLNQLCIPEMRSSCSWCSSLLVYCWIW